MPRILRSRTLDREAVFGINRTHLKQKKSQFVNYMKQVGNGVGQGGLFSKASGIEEESCKKGIAKAGGAPDQSIPYITLHGCSWDALRPPHP